jgi:LysM repeat protein
MMATTTVKKGDTLTAIAKKAGISLDALIKLNPQIKNPNLINPGQVITITKPTPAAPVAAPAGGTDSQNAARLAAQAKTAVPVAATPAVTGTGSVTSKATVTTVPATPPVVEDVPVNVNFADLSAEGQAAIGAIGEGAVVPAATPASKTVKSKTPKYDITGKLLGYDIVYSDDSSTFEAAPSSEVKKFTWKNPTTGQLESFDTAEEMQAAVDTWKVQSGQESTNAATERAATTARAEALAGRTSAFDLLRDQFDQWGMGDLVEPIRALIQDENVSPSEYAIRLRQTTPYQTRFKANAERVKNGLAAITEAEYLQLEDQYQNIMRNYGLPESYYVRGKYGVQEGFQNFIANDVSAVELEDRIMNAQNRVINSNPEVLATLKNFYPDITNGDILAYTLDPKNGLDQIKRKITAAEIGGAAVQAGLNRGETPEQRAAYAARAGELGAAGITKAQAQQGFQTVAELAPRGGQLAAMYGESPYTQQTAEQEVFGLGGSVEAAKQRKKLVGLEQASFAGQAGTAQGALGRERAGNF